MINPDREAHRADVDLLADELRLALGGDVRFDQMNRMLYSTDASNYQIEPIGVVMPRHADDVVAAHEIASKYGVPLLPRGAGSALAGQTVGHALVMDLSRYMRRVIAIDADARRVRVESGMVLGHLNAQLAPLGLMVGPDPASADRATVGGCLGNNATGMHSILYGMFGDHVEQVDVVLADGERMAFGNGASQSARGLALEETIRGLLRQHAGAIEQRFPKTWRTVAGYNLNRLDPDHLNLARLFVGAEGTLGTILTADLALVRRPTATRQILLHFDEMRAALEAVPSILEVEPSAVELLDKMLLDRTRAHLDYRHYLTFVEGDPEAILVVEFYGENEGELAGKVDRLREQMSRRGFHGATVIASTAAEMANVLTVRKAGLGLLMSARSPMKPIPFIEDAAVPVDRLADYVDDVREICAGYGVSFAIYAHASAGCLHIRPLIDLRTAEGLQRYRGIAEAVTELILRYEGTTSGEHGEGLARGEFSRKLFGPELTEAFREVKCAFDPQGLMNPGKVVDVGPMDDPRILRYGPDYATPYEPVNLRLDWSRDDGFAGAVEMCNGAGVCRKEGSGVMCPSFMATRDERDSTRARANALRLAMSGQLGIDGTSDRRVYEVLDLCLSCKACKAECPSAVDMARLKAEFTASYYDAHGIPLRSRLFANIHRLNRLGSLVPMVANAALSAGITRWLFARVGITPHRQLPLLARERFSTWFKRHHAASAPSQKRAPILFSDTYTEYNYPHLGRAVVRLAEAAGMSVTVWGPGQIGCCGRPAISKGLLDDARKMAVRNVVKMAEAARQGERFMIIEPSCAATFRDEYPDLVPAELRADAELVAAAVMTVEEWVAEAVSAGDFAHLSFDDTPRKVLLHGHCYQRALWGTSAAHKLLGLVPNCRVKELDDGCCGVAGSFGFEAEHYDISVAIGEQRLLPALRVAPEAIVVASGVSCREQIEHGSGRQALHPIEFLASCLAD